MLEYENKKTVKKNKMTESTKLKIDLSILEKILTIPQNVLQWAIYYCKQW
jgi:hypothetical protein